MTAIPSYVRVRLAAGVTGPHPDADLLAAFSERVLSERERSLVLGHVALCAECRDVLALALPEIEVAAAVPQAARGRSLAPSLKWATMLAGLTAVGVVALMILPGRHHSSSVYLAKSANVISPPARTVNGAPAEYDRVAASNHNERRDQPVAKAKKASPTAGSAFTSSGAMARLTLPATEAKERQNAIAIGGDIAAAPPAAQPAAPALADAQQATAPVASRTMATAELAKLQAMNRRELPAVRWRLSDTGAVLRSSDGGATWAPAGVDVPTKFRSLSVFAHHVWAGGADGKIYHSPDSGDHWEILRPASAQGTPLSGEIVGLEFTDALHGRASSSAREVWMTADGGRTWIKQ